MMGWRLLGRDADYVIVGAGAAGCVLADRLSASGASVVLLEAGGSDRATEVQIPAAFAKLFKGPRDWSYVTEPEPELNRRKLFWPQGKMLGGSSSMNAQMYVRGHAADYDRWAELGNPGWGWGDVLPVFQQLERRPGNARSTYGRRGAQLVEDLRSPNRSTLAFLEACAENGIPRWSDLSQAGGEGASLVNVTQKRGQRFSASEAFLRPAMKRKNLTVTTRALAERVVFSGSRAIGVEVRDARGRKRVVRAAREVILAAGAIGSPQLLLLSGIGDRQHLQSHGIEVRHELTGVGEELSDHLMLGVIRKCPARGTLVDAEKPWQLIQYLLFRRGMLTSNVGEGVALIRSRPELRNPDLELIFAPAPYVDHGLVPITDHAITLALVLLQPESRGRITLASADPASPPRIEPRYFSDRRDLDTVIAGVRRVQEILDCKPLARFVGEPIEPNAICETDAEIEQFARAQAETLYHPAGTCRMGSDERAVVDSRLRVHGLEGLRVVDASIMPTLMRGHPYAPTLMIAMRAARMILDDLKVSS